jgi:nucleoporin NUP82
MRLASFPLTIQSDSPRLRSAKLISKDDQDASKSLVLADGPPGYVSLLGNEPFTLPQTLSRPLGLPSYPLLSLPNSPKSSGSEFTLTPDTLRYLGKIVECFTTQIHEVQLAHRATVLRLELQKQESLRQQDTCRDMVNLTEKLKHQDISQDRITKIRKEQTVLLARLDRILRLQMKKASPSLSEHERKWFEELKGLQEEVCGAGRYDQDSLTARAAAVRTFISDNPPRVTFFLQLEKEYNRILPDLKVMLEKEAEHKKRLSESNKGLGLNQAFKFGERSVIQYVSYVTL